MTRRLLVCAVGLVLAAAAASAQSGICSGGTTDPFFAPVFGPNGVSIRWETQQFVIYSNSYLPVTTAGVVGNDINVVQTAPEVAPPPNWSPPLCGTGSVLLGNLPPGTYNVTWTYSLALVVPPIATYHFTIEVPANVPLFDAPALAAMALALAAVGGWMLRR